ncbi:hypothetical protein L484_003194 [Morus notabilis]|uniref:Uncharacterized protein n=1 Tax=Morus notabilis TaxID=981085 RepID=W9QRF8_9ROSA|nr:hypothetical protein L484_003194 [Morus notabilis]
MSAIVAGENLDFAYDSISAFARRDNQEAIFGAEEIHKCEDDAVENKEAAKTSNPIILWQVIANAGDRRSAAGVICQVMDHILIVSAGISCQVMDHNLSGYGRRL